jgi:histidinol-phosphate aminotransferase
MPSVELAALPFGYAIAPRRLADALRVSGLGNPRSLNRLAVRAASVSLGDTAHLARVRTRVKLERTRYHELFSRLGLRFSDARASFVFFESKRPQAELAARLAAEAIEIGRAFPPLLNWTRISIGLPDENLRGAARLAAHIDRSCQISRPSAQRTLGNAGPL